MILAQRVLHLIAMRGDALSSGNVDERVVVLAVRGLSHVADRLQFFFRMQKAFVASGNVVVHFDPEHSAGLRIAHNLQRIAAFQPIGADANVVSPVLFFGIRRCDQPRREQKEK